MTTIDIAPQDAVQHFQKERKSEVRPQTHLNQKYHLRRFQEWSDDTDIESMLDINGFVINQYKTWRRDKADLAEVTLYNELCSIRTFVRWCERREIVPQGLADKIDVPTPGDDTRDETIAVDRVKEILQHNKRVNGADSDTVLFYLLWHTGMRIGSANALDVEDWDRKTERLHLCNRPETDTPLKNGNDAERFVSITSTDLSAMLSDYIDYNHTGVTDKHGRNPLFPSRQGRPTSKTLRVRIQSITQPCRYTGKCPHSEAQEDCAALQNVANAYKCPSAVSPHPIRRTSITEHLNADVPKDVVSERANVSRKVLDKHYNAQTEEQKVSIRETYLDSLDH